MARVLLHARHVRLDDLAASPRARRRARARSFVGRWTSATSRWAPTSSTRPEADAPAGSNRGHRASAQQFVALSLRYVHKQVDRAIEDTGSLDAQGNEIYVVANPGEGLTAIAFHGSDNPPAEGNARLRQRRVRVREAVRAELVSPFELSLEPALWQLFGTVAVGRERAHVSPNVGRLFDYPLMMFRDGGVAAFGPLATDRPHQFKTQFIYQFTFGTAWVSTSSCRAACRCRVKSGSIRRTTCRSNISAAAATGGRRCSRRPTCSCSTRSSSWALAALQFSLNVLNLFNQETAVGKFSTYQKTNGVIPDEAAFYAGTADARVAHREPGSGA